MAERPEAADFAITVVDAFQHRGVGDLMLRRILEAARKRGYAHLIADLLLENTVARRLIESVAPRAKCCYRGDLLRFEIPLDDDDDDDADAGAEPAGEAE
jgi:GNAT superfamily N-acetyltransferase